MDSQKARLLPIVDFFGTIDDAIDQNELTATYKNNPTFGQFVRITC